MRFRLLLLLLLAAAWLPARARRPLKIVFYNVENLFDTTDDPTTRDDDFTPRGAMRWTEARCADKLERLARVLADIDAAEGGPAAVIGLAEIETPVLTERLVRRLSALRAQRHAPEHPHADPDTAARRHAPEHPHADPDTAARRHARPSPAHRAIGYPSTDFPPGHTIPPGPAFHTQRPATGHSASERPAASGLSPADTVRSHASENRVSTAAPASSAVSSATDPIPAAATPLAADSLPPVAGTSAAADPAHPAGLRTARHTAGAYAVVHEQSADPRGIDVALLYRPDLFELQGYRAEPLDPAAPSRPTRDLLTAWGRLRGRPCFFLVAHLPSRRGGQAAASLRLAAGRRMRAIVDSVRRADPGLRVVVMGDLNDDPVDPSVTGSLRARLSVADTEPGGLYNPFFDLFRAGRGTLVYDRTWQLFDQILVSDNLLGNDACDATDRPADATPPVLTAAPHASAATQTATSPLPTARPSDAQPQATTPTHPHPAADAPAAPHLRLVADPATGFRATIFAPDYLLQPDGRYRGCPLRTYSGRRYVGGYSDHLPVWIRLE